MAVTRLNKSANLVRTGSGNYNLPREDMDALYGPGWPIQPTTRPEDSELPRTLNYPVGINYTLQPRVGYEGLMPIAALKSAYSNIAEVAHPVNLIIRELSGFIPMLRDKKTQLRVKTGHPYQWMTISPDRMSPFNVWMTKYKKSAKIFAAPTFYKRRENGTTVAMEYIDGSTIFLIINSRGDLPRPNEVDPEIQSYMQSLHEGKNAGKLPALAQEFLTKQQDRLQRGQPLVTTTPAFTQIINGIPFSFWDQDQVYFSPEPPSPSVSSPYGESYIERAWTWINIIATMTAFELAHYRTGNTPEGLMMLPKDMFPTMTKLATGEREWNARMADGSQVQHARNRWMPEGTVYVPTKKPDWPMDLYSQAVENILHAIGVPPSEIGKKGGDGLGGAGFEQGAAHDVTRQILEGEKTSLENAFNMVLLKEDVDDVEFYMDYPQEEIDPMQQQEDLWNKFSHGVSSLNDVLTAQGKQPLGDIKDPENIANQHLIIAGSTIFVVEKMKSNEIGMIAPASPPPGLPNMGGSPQNPEDQELGDKKGIPPKKGFPQQVAKMIEEQGRISNITYSIPPELAKAPIPHAEEPVFPPADVDLVQWEKGMEEEGAEHLATLGGNWHLISGLVVDHLRKDPNYYVTQDPVIPDPAPESVPLNKSCGLDPEDAEYFGAPLNTKLPLDLTNVKHANDTEVVAMQPEDHQAQIALWKPAKGEDPKQAEVVGGAQYLREEAAYLIDRSLGFFLVPVAYVTDSEEGEPGAVCWFVYGDTTPRAANTYSKEWIEKAGVFDYVMGQLDRSGKNYLTHPQDSDRPVLYDNGMSLPTVSQKAKSDFEALMETPLSAPVLQALQQTLKDLSMWNDVEDLIGAPATQLAQDRVEFLIENAR